MTVQELPLLMRLKLNKSIFPDDEVGDGLLPPAHLIVAAEPLIVIVDGKYPVDPCGTIKLTVKTLPSVTGAFVILTVAFAVNVLVR